MALLTIRYEISLSALREELMKTAARLRAHPQTTTKAADYDLLLKELEKLAAKEQQLKDEKLEADAQIDALDMMLDPQVDRLSNALLDRTGQQRDSELYQRYFGVKRPHEVKKPVLGEEVQIVKDFVPSLLASSDAGLLAIGQELDKLVKAAQKAETAYSEAASKLRDFRKVGERKAFIDKVNQKRKLTHGELAQMPHTPGSTLPRDFASGFFGHSKQRVVTIENLRAQIAEKEAELAELREDLKAAEAAAAAETLAVAAKERLHVEAELRKVEQEHKALLEKQSRLRSRLSPTP
jgi:hypothetical protein